MQTTPILICLVLISIVQAALVTRIPKPKLSLVHSQNLQIAEPPKHKSPEERRKFSLFPKSYMKYVISSEPIYKIATHKPIVHGTKKPLMKKLSLLDKNNKTIDNETVQPIIINTETINENNVDVTPKVNVVEVSEELRKIVEDKSEESNENQNDNSEEHANQNDFNEIKKSTVDTVYKESPNLKDLIFPPKTKPVVVIEEESKVIVVKKSEESNEKQNDNSGEEDALKNDSSEIKKPTADTVNKESPDFKDLILPPETKPVEVSTGNKNIEAFTDAKKNSEENDTPDWMEFIFINPAHKPTTDKNDSEEPEEYITTEFYEESENVRMKRGSNVIEEENLASTVAGYKYTWKDTRLSNDVAFKNIHS